ncbi:MAG: hypothetical protein WAU57_20300 [Xanthobacteraceae bacterium]
MPTVEVVIVLGEDGGCEVARDEDTALEQLKVGSAEDLTGTSCRVVKLNVTMSEPHWPDDDEAQTDKAVDVSVPDDAGRVVEIETD